MRKVTTVASVMTKHTARLMPEAVDSLFDTPRKGQIPRNCARTILLTKIAEMMMSRYSITSYFLASLLNRTIR